MNKQTKFLCMLRHSHSEEFQGVTDDEILNVIFPEYLRFMPHEDHFQDDHDYRRKFANWASSDPIRRAIWARDYTVINDD